MDDVEKIKQKLDIVDIIGEYIKLQKAGRNFKAVCPFHNEKSPSFVVSPERQIWHCFGCNKGGDVITFVQEYDSINFSEALKFLAQKAGVQLTQSAFSTEKEKKKDLLYELNHLAAQFYNFLLLEHKIGKTAKEYVVDKRNIPEPLAKKFLLGYAPSARQTLFQYLNRKKGYRAEDIIEAGLATQSGRDITDFFYGRIIFPIYDIRGNIIAFSGRAMDDKTLPKYINTRDTKLYRKSESLYGIFYAKDGIKKENRAILVEGEFDVLSSFREGIGNVVAVKGTALTLEQIRLLKRFCDKVSFCFDTDPAGTAAQKRSIQLIEQEQISASAIVLPEGKDPDELLNSNPALFKQSLKNDKNIYEYIVEQAVKTHNPKTVEGKRKILDETLPFLAIVENEVIKEHYLKKVATLLDTSYEAVAKQAEKIGKPKEPEIIVPRAVKTERAEALEQYLLALILQHKDPVNTCKKVSTLLARVNYSESAYAKVLKYLSEYDALEFNTKELVKQLPKELHPAFDASFLFPVPSFDEDRDYEKELTHAANQLCQFIIRAKLNILSRQIQEKEHEGAEQDLEKLQQEFNTLTSLLNQRVRT